MAEEQLDKPGHFEPIEIALGDGFFVNVDIQYHRVAYIEEAGLENTESF